MAKISRRRVGVACQGGGSHTAFTAGVLQGLLSELPEDAEVVAFSGTSGGAICAALAWEGLLRHDPNRGSEKLQEFWETTSATKPWDQLANQLLVATLSLKDLAVLPEITPYQLPPWGEDRLRTILKQYFDFEELRRLALQPGAPRLQVGAVEVLSGSFEVFTGEELCVEALLASAAIPDLFRAVEVPGRGVYWDGLFSQNPPIKNLLDNQLDELWVIQINPSTSSQVPTRGHQIFDRRNQLSGNLSMVQELHFIDSINQAIARGMLIDPKYRMIQVERIHLDRELDYRSKMDRSPGLLQELRKYGQAKWRWFVKERAAKSNAAAVHRSTRGAAPSSEQLPSE
jgi:NTE family protein